MCLNLLNRIQGHTDHDQEGGAPEVKRDVEFAVENSRENTDGRDINRPSEGNSSEHLIDILSGFLSGANTWDITAEFFHVFGDIIRVERNCRIKIAEEDNESHVEKIIEEGTRA